MKFIKCILVSENGSDQKLIQTFRIYIFDKLYTVLYNYIWNVFALTLPHLGMALALLFQIFHSYEIYQNNICITSLFE